MELNEESLLSNIQIFEDYDELSKRFIKGLETHNLTMEEIKNWIRCGGSDDIDKFREIFPDRNLPPHQEYCICGHDIIHNKYITNLEKTEILVLGSCCAQRFCPKKCDVCFKEFKSTSKTCKECRNKKNEKERLERQKLCEICEEPHKNRKDNLCHDCRETHKRCVICEEYFEFYNKYYDYCEECHEKNNKRERKIRQRENEIKQRKIEKNYKKNMNAKKGLMNANQTATKIKQIKQCSECNQNYETYDTLEEQCLCTDCKQTKQAQMDEENRLIKEENIKKNQRVGLMCYCELRTTLREVKKDGPNKEKLFYCCSKSCNNNDKCNYFMWKDESDRRINKNIQINSEEQKEDQIEENNKSNEMICYCNLPAIQLIVKKDGHNNGRKFYKCPKYNDDKCKYFKWEDEINM
jgi:hypothetical protein